MKSAGANAPRSPDPDGPRDVLLLTHPRNLREPEVVAAARTLRKSDRLFALAVDEEGRAELVQWAAGGPVPVRAFRVDLVGAEAARVEGEAPARPPDLAGWRTWAGDVEPVPFPFRPGLVAEPAGFGFDVRGDWAVVVGKDGTPHGLPVGGGPPEVLPRPFAGGVVLRHPEAVLGVSGGVVLCGRMSLRNDHPAGSVTIVSPGAPVGSAGATEYMPPEAAADTFVAAHYDFAARRVTLHRLGPGSDRARWVAYPDLHCVAVRVASNMAGSTGCAVDLATLHRFPGPASGSLQARALEAWRRVDKGGTPPFELPVRRPGEQHRSAAGQWYLYQDNVTLMPTRPEGENWQPFQPMRDGKPLLNGGTVERAVLAESVLCLRVSRGKERRLLLFRGPAGNGLGEVADAPPNGPFTLSADGRWLARRRGAREVVVSETADVAAAPVVATLAGLHSNLTVALRAGPFALTISIGEYVHVFGLDRGELAYSRRGDAPRPGVGRLAPPEVGYDANRFPPRQITRAGLFVAVADRLGQVLLFVDALDDGFRQVAAFLVRRDKAAAWAGGAFWGDPGLIGGPPTPGAARAIGETIRAAGA